MYVDRDHFMVVPKITQEIYKTNINSMSRSRWNVGKLGGTEKMLENKK